MLLKPLQEQKQLGQKTNLLLVEEQLLGRQNQALIIFKSKLDKMALEIKNKLSIKFVNKQKDIRLIFFPTELIRIKCEETVSLSSLSTYLTNVFYELLIKSESGNGEEVFFVIKKVQFLIAFCKSNFEKTNFENEIIFSKINELVFYQNNDLIDSFIQKFSDLSKYLKNSAPKIRKMGNSALITGSQEVINYFKGNLLSLKMKTKTLFAMALMYSDQKQHDKAIQNAQKALKCSLSVLQLTICWIYFKLYQMNLKLKTISEESKRNKQISKQRKYIKMIQILDSIIEKMAVTKSIFKPSAKITSALSYFKSAYQEVNVVNMEEDQDIDLGYLNNPEVINSCLLKESTILHLTNLNFMSYDQENNESLLDEVSEKSLLEKIANISVSFYILSVEHRFMEHMQFTQTKFYKNLLDYFNPTFKTKSSETFLAKAVEIAYLYLPDCFPFVSQILLVFKNFELNRSKQIPEHGEEVENASYLYPFKNGFKSNLIIPIIRIPQQQTMKLGSMKENWGKESHFQVEKQTQSKTDKEQRCMIKKIYDPKNRLNPKKEKRPIGVLRSPELSNQKQINAINVNSFKSTMPMVFLDISNSNHSSAKTTPVIKNNSQKFKSETKTTKKPRVGSSKLVPSKENETGKTEKRANSSEISRSAIEKAKKTKKSSNSRFPAQSTKNDFSLLKSTEFLFHENYKKVALKLKHNNENMDWNKKSPATTQAKTHQIDRKTTKEDPSLTGAQTCESSAKEPNTNFFLQHFSQKPSPMKQNGNFKINSGGKVQQTVYFQNFIKNKNNIAEILSKFK